MVVRISLTSEGGRGTPSSSAGDDGVDGNAPEAVRAQLAGHLEKGAERQANARRRWLPAMLVLVVLVVAWLAVAGWTVLKARNTALSATDKLQQLRASTDLSHPDTQRLASELPPIAASFSEADTLAHRGWVRVLRPLPVIGTQVRSMEALSRSAAGVTNALATAAQQLDQTLGGIKGGTVTRAAAASSARDVLGELLPRLDVNLGPRSHLLPQLARAHTRLSGELADLHDQLVDAHSASAGVAAFLDNKRYLVLAANTAEMRIGSGMTLQAGVVKTANGGSMTVETFGPVQTLQPSATPPITDLDVASNWGFLTPTRRWENVAATPRFAVVAQSAVAMWRTRDTGPIDGVISLDPTALAGLLKATGPVTVEDHQVTADNVVEWLDNGQYALTVNDPTNAERKDQLAGMTQAIMMALQERKIDLFALLSNLRPAAAGRHIKAWSADATQQKAWEALGIAGEVPDNGVLVAVSNHGADKLDHFLKVDANLQMAANQAGTQGLLRVRLRNDVPAGQPAYVLGKNTTPGAYFGVLTLELPAAATAIKMDGIGLAASAISPVQQEAIIVGRQADKVVAIGRDGPLRLVSVSVSLAPGQAVERDLHFTLPPGTTNSVTVIPSGRAPGINWAAPGQSDSASFTVTSKK